MKKLLSLLLTMTLLLSSSTIAFAADNTTTVTTAGTQSVTVTATIGSAFTVTIPKTIAINAGTKTATYTISVSGDIAGDETLAVTPAASFVMQQNGKADVTATVTQVKKSWSYSDITSTPSTTGTISATGLSGGAWEGSLNFTISLSSSGS